MPTDAAAFLALLACLTLLGHTNEEVLGHTQMATTADLYSHVMPELQRQAADRMEEVLGG